MITCPSCKKDVVNDFPRYLCYLNADYTIHRCENSDGRIVMIDHECYGRCFDPDDPCSIGSPR